MHVVICGQIRHLACTRALLVRLARGRRAGHVASAIFVAWRSQADMAAGLVADVPGAIDSLTVIDEPEIASPGHFFHQVRSLDRGLEGLAADDLVLRLRPDLFVEEGFFEAVGDRMSTSGRALWTPYADLTAPFFACDIVFGGRAAALRRQSNFSMEPYLRALPPMSARSPSAVCSHEPEIQRWLHPVHDQCSASRTYWSMFASMGFATRQRSQLVQRYQDWDFYTAIRLRWLDYLLDQVSLGGLETGARAGLVRSDQPTARECSAWMLQHFVTAAAGSLETILGEEPNSFVWTADLEDVSRLRQALGGAARPERQWSTDAVFADLIQIKREASDAPTTNGATGLKLPFRIAKVTYEDPPAPVRVRRAHPA